MMLHLFLGLYLTRFCMNMLSRLEREEFVENLDDSDFLCILFSSDSTLSVYITLYHFLKH